LGSEIPRFLVHSRPNFCGGKKSQAELATFSRPCGKELSNIVLPHGRTMFKEFLAESLEGF